MVTVFTSEYCCVVMGSLVVVMELWLDCCGHLSVPLNLSVQWYPSVPSIQWHHEHPSVQGYQAVHDHPSAHWVRDLLFLRENLAPLLNHYVLPIPCHLEREY